MNKAAEFYTRCFRDDFEVLLDFDDMLAVSDFSLGLGRPIFYEK